MNIFRPASSEASASRDDREETGSAAGISSALVLVKPKHRPTTISPENLKQILARSSEDRN
jgi:hypothetical protein